MPSSSKETQQMLDKRESIKYLNKEDQKGNQRCLTDIISQTEKEDQFDQDQKQVHQLKLKFQTRMESTSSLNHNQKVNQLYTGVKNKCVTQRDISPSKSNQSGSTSFQVFKKNLKDIPQNQNDNNLENQELKCFENKKSSYMQIIKNKDSGLKDQIKKNKNVFEKILSPEKIFANINYFESTQQLSKSSELFSKLLMGQALSPKNQFYNKLSSTNIQIQEDKFKNKKQFPMVTKNFKIHFRNEVNTEIKRQDTVTDINYEVNQPSYHTPIKHQSPPNIFAKQDAKNQRINVLEIINEDRGDQRKSEVSLIKQFKKSEIEDNLETQRKNQLKKIVALNRSREKIKGVQMLFNKNNTQQILQKQRLNEDRLIEVKHSPSNFNNGQEFQIKPTQLKQSNQENINTKMKLSNQNLKQSKTTGAYINSVYCNPQQLSKRDQYRKSQDENNGPQKFNSKIRNSSQLNQNKQNVQSNDENEYPKQENIEQIYFKQKRLSNVNQKQSKNLHKTERYKDKEYFEKNAQNQNIDMNSTIHEIIKQQQENIKKQNHNKVEFKLQGSQILNEKEKKNFQPASEYINIKNIYSQQKRSASGNEQHIDEKTSSKTQLIGQLIIHNIDQKQFNNEQNYENQFQKDAKPYFQDNRKSLQIDKSNTGQKYDINQKNKQQSMLKAICKNNVEVLRSSQSSKIIAQDGINLNLRSQLNKYKSYQQVKFAQTNIQNQQLNASNSIISGNKIKMLFPPNIPRQNSNFEVKQADKNKIQNLNYPGITMIQQVTKKDRYNVQDEDETINIKQNKQIQNTKFDGNEATSKYHQIVRFKTQNNMDPDSMFRQQRRSHIEQECFLKNQVKYYNNQINNKSSQDFEQVDSLSDEVNIMQNGNIRSTQILRNTQGQQSFYHNFKKSKIAQMSLTEDSQLVDAASQEQIMPEKLLNINHRISKINQNQVQHLPDHSKLQNQIQIIKLRSGRNLPQIKKIYQSQQMKNKGNNEITISEKFDQLENRNQTLKNQNNQLDQVDEEQQEENQNPIISLISQIQRTSNSLDQQNLQTQQVFQYQNKQIDISNSQQSQNSSFQDNIVRNLKNEMNQVINVSFKNILQNDKNLIQKNSFSQIGSKNFRENINQLQIQENQNLFNLNENEINQIKLLQSTVQRRNASNESIRTGKSGLSYISSKNLNFQKGNKLKQNLDSKKINEKKSDSEEENKILKDRNEGIVANAQFCSISEKSYNSPKVTDSVNSHVQIMKSDESVKYIQQNQELNDQQNHQNQMTNEITFQKSITFANQIKSESFKSQHDFEKKILNNESYNSNNYNQNYMKSLNIDVDLSGIQDNSSNIIPIKKKQLSCQKSNGIKSNNETKSQACLVQYKNNVQALQQSNKNAKINYFNLDISTSIIQNKLQSHPHENSDFVNQQKIENTFAKLRKNEEESRSNQKGFSSYQKLIQQQISEIPIDKSQNQEMLNFIEYIDDKFQLFSDKSPYRIDSKLSHKQPSSADFNPQSEYSCSVMNKNEIQMNQNNDANKQENRKLKLKSEFNYKKNQFINQKDGMKYQQSPMIDSNSYNDKDNQTLMDQLAIENNINELDFLCGLENSIKFIDQRNSLSSSQQKALALFELQSQGDYNIVQINQYHNANDNQSFSSHKMLMNLQIKEKQRKEFVQNAQKLSEIKIQKREYHGISPLKISIDYPQLNI